MKTTTQLPESKERTVPAASQRTVRARWAIAAALAALVALGTMLVLNRTPEPEPVAPVDPVNELGLQAVDEAELWLESALSGEVDTILELAPPAQSDLDDQRMWEYHAVLAASGLPAFEPQGCEVAQASESLVVVDCAVAMTDPVAQVLGITDLVFPFWYSSGSLTWQPAQGGDLGLLNAAYADYLQLFHPDAYSAACAPAAYEPGTIVQSNGFALTGECAALTAPIAQDVAAWVENGRPQP